MPAKFHRSLFVILGFLMSLLVLGTASVSAAVDATINNITRDGCDINIVFTVDDAGSYQLVIYDDGLVIHNENFSVGAGAQVTATYEIVRAVGGDAPGYGIQVEAGGVGLDSVDPFSIPAAVANECARLASIVDVCGAVIPGGSVVGRALYPVALYWEPVESGETSYILDMTVDPKTYWVLGTDASGEFYQILWDCDFRWVPVDSTGPNWGDPVWNGAPLPNRVSPLVSNS